MWPSPVVALNRAIALRRGRRARRRRSPRSSALEAGGELARYRYLPATRADLLRRLGRRGEAATAYRAALALTDNAAERAFLEGRLAVSED